jgi:hypothetical protein
VRHGVFAAVLLLVAGCGGDDSVTTAVQSTARTATTSAQATTAASNVGPRCVAGTSVITNALDSGLKRKPWTLTDVYAVKTREYGSVFFVSGRVKGAPKRPIGTWATNNLNLGGLMFSVDPVAKKLSKWGDASAFDAKLTMKLDGARQSRACVRQSQG